MVRAYASPRGQQCALSCCDGAFKLLAEAGEEVERVLTCSRAVVGSGVPEQPGP